MRIVICGQKWLGVEALKLCLRRGDEVLKVFTPGTTGEEYDRLYAAAQQAGIPAETCNRRLEAARLPPGVDLIVCAHFHGYISQEARQTARLGALGYHPSLLPRHRGKNAVERTIQAGDTVAGGSVYWLDNGWDTGMVAAQETCRVQPGDTSQSLWRRDLAPMGIRLLARVLARLDADKNPTGAKKIVTREK